MALPSFVKKNNNKLHTVVSLLFYIEIQLTVTVLYRLKHNDRSKAKKKNIKSSDPAFHFNVKCLIYCLLSLL